MLAAGGSAGLPPEIITAASGIVIALLAGVFGVPWLQRRQNRRAAEVSALEATDKLVFNRVKFLAAEFEELAIEHAELRAEVAAERILRAQTVTYLRRLVRWSRSATAPEPMPEPPDELDVIVHD